MASKDQATKSRSKSSKSARSSVQLEKLKTVVRRLPPNLPEEIFWQSVLPWVSEETVSWKVFYPGKLRKKYNKENIPSRAYIAFKDIEQLAAFSQAYDGHIFRDKSGHEAQAVVEFAPFQKIPTERKKMDPRIATIEQDEDYVSFLQSLNAPTGKAPEADTIEMLLASTHAVTSEPKSTPLLDALKAEKSAAKEKEASIRIQVHPARAELPVNSNVNPKKEDLKKKAPPSQPPQVESTPSSISGGKRGRGKKLEAAKPPVTSQGSVPAPGPSEKHSHPQSPPQPKPLPTQPKGARLGREPPPRGPPQKSSVTPAPKQVLTSNFPNAPKADAVASSSTEQHIPRERPRRPLIGLQTRHFEAALSGAGVAISPGGNDRKSRRDQDKSDLGPQDQTAGNLERSAISVVESRSKEHPKSFGKRKEGDDRIVESTSGPRTGHLEGQISSSPQLDGQLSKSPSAPRRSADGLVDASGRGARRSGRDTDEGTGFRGGRGGGRGRPRERGAPT